MFQYFFQEKKKKQTHTERRKEENLTSEYWRLMVTERSFHRCELCWLREERVPGGGLEWGSSRANTHGLRHHQGTCACMCDFSLMFRCWKTLSMLQLRLYFLFISEISVMTIKTQGQDVFGHMICEKWCHNIFISARVQKPNVPLTFLFGFLSFRIVLSEDILACFSWTG